MASPYAEVLIDMGFTKEKVDRALEVTGNQGVEPAMEWLLAHADDWGQSSMEQVAPPEGQTTGSSDSAEANPEEPSPEEAQSLKCDECGKLFRSQAEVEFHAAKTQHSKFSESTEIKKPLTEEEKQQQLKMIEEKLKQKKKEREEKDKQENAEREKNRIRAGKEMVAIKKKMDEDELKKAIELRKKEKEDDRLAREKIKQQIEADKLARKAKQLEQQGVQQTSPVTSPPPETQAPPVKKDYNETRIQIRLTNGSTLTQTFGVKEQLSAVRLFVEINGSEYHPISLMTNFPKKVFSEEDYEKPLDVLGLVPSAVLIVTRTSGM